MTFLWMIVGAVLGGWLSWVVFDDSVGMIGTVFGLVCGWLFGRTVRLGQRVGQLEAQLKTLAARGMAAETKVPAPATRPAEDVLATTTVTPVVAAPLPAAAEEAATAAFDLRTVTAHTEALTRDSGPAQPETSPHSAEQNAPTPPRGDNILWAWAKSWLTEGNPLVKAGIVVVFF